MYKNHCKKCGGIDFNTEAKSRSCLTGLYCLKCGAWIKWIGGEELRTFKYEKKT